MPGRSATPAAPGGRSAPIPGLGSGSTPWGNFSSVYEPAAGVTKIGRSPDNDIVVEDLLVSRHHAELRTDRGGQRVIVDLGSYNGTFVGGQRVDRAVLTEGATTSS
jgi:pSer/pThr/pTyr-binding forkhead associated (FHA) protein